MKFWTLLQAHRGRTRLGAGVMLCVWLATFALATLPHLHHLLHSDAQNLTHHCLITQLQRHSVYLGPAVLTQATPPAQAVANHPCEVVPLCSASDWRWSPSRAPPAAPAQPVVGS